MTIQVLLAIVSSINRFAIRTVVNETRDIEIVDEVENIKEAQYFISELHPDLLLIDLKLLEPATVEFLALDTHSPKTKLLILSDRDHDAFLAFFETKAAGIINKDERTNSIIEKIHQAARGHQLYSREERKRAYRWRQDAGTRWKCLSDRERDVLSLLIEGLTNETIAEQLHITVKTVECHLSSIYTKLEVSSRLEAVVWVRDLIPGELWNFDPRFLLENSGSKN